MAYGVKYRTQWYDRLTRLIRVDIEQDGYSSSVNEPKAGKTPLKMQRAGEGDTKYLTMLGCTATITLISESNFQFSEFFNATSREYRVKIYIDSVLFHVLYVIPDVYKEAYRPAPYEVAILAADGLGDLRFIDFLDSDNDIIHERKSAMEIITTCLDTLGLDLDIYSAVNVFEENMDQAASDDPLVQAYHACTRFYDEDYTPWKCYDVLKHLLFPYGACRMFQSWGAWHIVPFEEFARTYPRRKFNSSGVYQSNDTKDPVVALTGSGASLSTMNAFAGQTPMLSVLPAYKRLEVIQDAHLRDSMIPFWNFPKQIFSGDQDDCEISKWYKSESGLTLRYSLYDDGNSIGMDYDAGGSRHVYNNLLTSDPIAAYPYFQTTYFKFSFEVRASVGLAKYKVLVTCGTHYHLHPDMSTWGLVPFSWDDDDYFMAEINPVDDWIEITHRVMGLPEGQIEIKLFEPPTGPGSVEYRNVKMKAEQAEMIGSEVNIDTEINEHYSYDPPRLVFKFGDHPAINRGIVRKYIDNAKEIFDGGITLSDGTCTEQWQWKGESAKYPLIELTIRSIINNYNINTQLLSCQLLSVIDFNSVLKDTNNSDKLFMLLGASWDAKRAIWAGEWAEVITRSTGYLLKEDGDKILQETGDKIELEQ